MRYACLFSGIGAPLQAAYRVYENVEHVFSCEFDKFARQSFQAIYGIDDKHFHKDVREMDGTQYQGKVDVLVGGSPCQSFSIAGLREGTADQRGQLIYQYVRIVEEVKAPVIIYENVKGIMSIDSSNTVKEFIEALRDVGYYCHYEIINSKDYGVPQNRERFFLVGFLDHEAYYRFQFAPKQPLTKRLKDVLESDVDEKYYLDATKINFVTDEVRQKKRYTQINGEIAITQQARQFANWNGDFIAEPKIFDHQGRKRKWDNPELLDHCPTLRAQTHGNEPCVVEEKYRIRKLTPLECWRLQDFPDDAHEKAKAAGVSDSQRYKQAGNSMTVAVLEMIFRQIEKAKTKDIQCLF